VEFGTFFAGHLTRQEIFCLASFRRLGHQVTVFSYDKLDMPVGITQMDARSILPKKAFFKVETGPALHHGSASQFSNLFRYHMIKKTGLVWIDTDVFCLRADWPDLPILIAWQGPVLVNNAVLRLPADHPALDDAIDAAGRIGRLAIWGYTGPFLLTALVQNYEMQRLVLPVDSFYPVHWSKAVSLIQPLPPGQEPRWPAGAYCVHFWNEILRMAGLDKSVGPPAQSPMGKLFALVSADMPELDSLNRGGSAGA
jgi:hypothetical protein